MLLEEVLKRDTRRLFDDMRVTYMHTDTEEVRALIPLLIERSEPAATSPTDC